MKPQTVASTGNSYKNPLYRPPGAGNVKKGPPPETLKGVNDFDLGSDFDGGEPQPVDKEGNLSIASGDQHHENSDTTASKVVIHFEDSQLNHSHNEEFVADSSTEHGIDDEPQPAPPPVKTASGPAQPTVPLSDDPAIAALQKSTLAATTQVVLYTTCLSVLTDAIKEHHLSPNSFSYLTGLFGGLIKDSETRTRELVSETEQLLQQHSEQAKALAAQAGSDTPPVPAATFSAGPVPAATNVDLKQALHEVKQLPDSAQRDQIVEGLRVALEGQGSVTHEDLDGALKDIQWELDNPEMAALDPELIRLHRQVNKEAEETEEAEAAETAALHADLDEMGAQMGNIQFPNVHEEFDPISFIAKDEDQQKPSTPLPPPEFFSERDALGTEAVPGKLHSAKKPIADTGNPAPKTEVEFDSELADLLADLENSANERGEQSNNEEKVAPNRINSATELSTTKPKQKLSDSDEEREQVQKKAEAAIAELTNETPLASQLMRSAPAKVKSAPQLPTDKELNELIDQTHYVLKIDDWSQVAGAAHEIHEVATRHFTEKEKPWKNSYIGNGGAEKQFRLELQKQYLAEAIEVQSKLVDKASEELSEIRTGAAMFNASIEKRKARVVELTKQIAIAGATRSTLRNVKL